MKFRQVPIKSHKKADQIPWNSDWMPFFAPIKSAFFRTRIVTSRKLGPPCWQLQAPFLTVALLAVASGALWFWVYWQVQAARAWDATEHRKATREKRRKMVALAWFIQQTCGLNGTRVVSSTIKSGRFKHQTYAFHQENIWLIWDVSSKHHGDFPGI